MNGEVTNEIDDNGYVIFKCPTCYGSGKRLLKKELRLIRKTEYKFTECSHCRGSGFLEKDWISVVYEEPLAGGYIDDGWFSFDSLDTISINSKTRTLKANWTIDTHQDMQAIYAEELATELAKEIDKEILGMLKGEVEYEDVDDKSKNNVSKTFVWGARRNPYDIGYFEA